MQSIVVNTCLKKARLNALQWSQNSNGFLRLSLLQTKPRRLFTNKIPKDPIDSLPPSRISGTDNSSSINEPSVINHSSPHHTTTVPESVKKTAESLGTATLQMTAEVNRAYHEIEQNLMHRINESNTQRFRVALIATLLFLVWVGSVFGGRIRAKVAQETAGLAKETLGDEALKAQTQSLATAVVHTVLTDADVANQAAVFLREAALAPDTQKALLSLILHVLQHPDSLTELSVLTSRVAQALSTDPVAIDSVAALLSSALVDPRVVSSASSLICAAASDPETGRALASLAARISQHEGVAEALKVLVTSSAQGVLLDSQVQETAREFAAEVMGDDRLQREGGDALWNSVSHALRPGLRRMAGVGLLALSIGLARIMLSPY